MAPADWPPDALVLLIGPAGVGKSSWIAGRVADDAIVSSDALRHAVAGDATDQSATADAFRILHAIVRARLRRGLLTVVDATNLTTSARRSLNTIAAKASRPVVAVVFDVPLTENLARNAARDRRVPDDVVRRHHDELALARTRIRDEGYAAVEVVTSEA